ncbi:MAG: T9SS type A sorting domain-containing protein [Bacteroidia bacterium]|nr:T9SS type A sorting domain-containing protein [Bacteroidia bacterium]
MNRLLIFICLSVLLSPAKLNAQAHLRVSSLVNWPDTVYANQILPVGAIVENIGTAAYQGPLQIVLETDSAYTYLYYNQSNTVLILPGDTLSFFPPGGYLFDSTVFRPGNNVVVVWPYSAQAVVIDTFSVTTYFNPNQLQGLDDPRPIPGLSIYPNPASDMAFILSPETSLESVRIWDVMGQEMIFLSAGNSFRMELPLTGLPAGLYLLEITGSSGQRSSYRLLKQQ